MAHLVRGERVRSYLPTRFLLAGAAFAKGLCKRCYRSAWYARNSAQEAGNNAEWRARNQDRTRQNWAEWYAKNRTPELLERRRAEASTYRNRNRDAVVERERQRWAAKTAAESAEQHAARLAARRARYAAKASHYRLKSISYTQSRNARKAGNAVSRTDYRAILDKHGMACHICGGEIATRADLHFDHVIPLSKGGPHEPENIRPAHAGCNMRKGSKIA